MYTTTTCKILTAALIFWAAIAVRAQKPLVIAEQGSFAVGGTKITQPGIFDLKNALQPTFKGA
jgi:hypothetical protein